VLFKQVKSDYGIEAIKASTCYSILVKTLKEPLEASYKTSPNVVKKLADVASSQHEQITVGAANDAYVNTPVIKAHTLAFESEIYDLFNGLFIMDYSAKPSSELTKIAYAISHAETPTYVNCSASKSVYIALQSATSVAKCNAAYAVTLAIITVGDKPVISNAVSIAVASAVGVGPYKHVVTAAGIVVMNYST